MITFSVGTEGGISLTQNVAVDGKIDVVRIEGQTVLNIPALGAEYHVVNIAPDFDDTLEIMDNA